MSPCRLEIERRFRRTRTTTRWLRSGLHRCAPQQTLQRPSRSPVMRSSRCTADCPTEAPGFHVPCTAAVATARHGRAACRRRREDHPSEMPSSSAPINRGSPAGACHNTSKRQKVFQYGRAAARFVRLRDVIVLHEKSNISVADDLRRSVQPLARSEGGSCASSVIDSRRGDHDSRDYRSPRVR